MVQLNCMDSGLIWFLSKMSFDPLYMGPDENLHCGAKIQSCLKYMVWPIKTCARRSESQWRGHFDFFGKFRSRNWDQQISDLNFYRILGWKFLKLLKLPKIILGAKKNLNHLKNRYPFLTRPPKNMFFCPKRDHICQIGQIGKGHES